MRESNNERQKTGEATEKRRSAFEHRVIDFSPEVSDTNFDENTANDFAARLERSKIALLGEMHGVAENPAIIYAIMKRFGINGLGLEWDHSLTEAVERYLQGEALDFERIAGSSDGRITAGHFSILRRLRSEGMLDQVILFDADGPMTWNERDRKMADHVLANRKKDSPLLVVAGNLHTRRDVMDFDDPLDPEPKKSLARNVLSEYGDVPVIKIEYHSGSFFNNEERNFEAKTQISHPSFNSTSSGDFVFDLPTAHPAAVPGNM